MYGVSSIRNQFSYRCRECGKLHTGAPSFSYGFPVYFFDVPENERDHRVLLTSDVCQITPRSDDPEATTLYCIRVILEIPIIDLDEPFTWGVWVTQSATSFARYIETFDEDQSNENSFGWLTVNMPYYKTVRPDGQLLNLKCDVQWGSPGKRPKIHLWNTEHQLSIDQRYGISWDKAATIAGLALADAHTQSGSRTSTGQATRS